MADLQVADAGERACNDDGCERGREDKARRVGPDRINETFGKRGLDNIDSVHCAVALCDARAARAIHADGEAACQDNDYGKIVKLALLTGARREEIGGLAWQEIDIERAELNLPPDRPKNGRPHIVPLSPVARRLLLRRLSARGANICRSSAPLHGISYGMQSVC